VSLLKDGPHVGVRGICGKRKFGLGVGMRQRDSRDKGRLGGLKGRLEGRGPRDAATAGRGVRERGQGAGNAREEATIKVEHSQKLLKTLDIRGGGGNPGWAGHEKGWERDRQR
jgi:hypothetical protein